MRIRKSIAARACTGLFQSWAMAGVVHDESIQGDISDDPSAPTPITLSPGGNNIIGTMVGGAGADVRDYVTFTIPPGSALTAINLVSYDHLTFGGNGNVGYHCIIAGSTSFIPNGGSGNNFLGGNHLFGFQVGTDILPGLAMAATNGTGFTAPLGPGTYTYQVQQTGQFDPTGYNIELVLSCGVTAASMAYGAGKPGTNGVPVLSSTSPPVIGGVADLTLSNGLPGASPVILFLGLTQTSIPFDGGTLLTNPIVTLGLPPLNATGGLTLPLNVPADSALCGFETFTQIYFIDPGAAGINQTAQTNGLRWRFGS